MYYYCYSKPNHLEEFGRRKYDATPNPEETELPVEPFPEEFLLEEPPPEDAFPGDLFPTYWQTNVANIKVYKIPRILSPIGERRHREYERLLTDIGEPRTEPPLAVAALGIYKFNPSGSTGNQYQLVSDQASGTLIRDMNYNVFFDLPDRRRLTRIMQLKASTYDAFFFVEVPVQDLPYFTPRGLL